MQNLNRPLKSNSCDDRKQDSINDSNAINHKGKSHKTQNLLQNLTQNSPQNHLQNCPYKQNSAIRFYDNFHFKDIFGFYHRFFRPFAYRFKALYVYIFPQSYFYSDSSEIVITHSKKALISNTSYFHHEFEKPKMTKGFLRNLLWCVKQIYKWLRFYLRKSTFINGNVAILHQSTNYYHFLCESMASFLQIRAFEAKTGIKIDFYTLDSTTAFQRQMWEILQIPRSKIISPQPQKLYKAKNIILPTHIANVEYVEYRDRITWSRAFALPTLLRDFYDEFALKYLNLKAITPFRKVFLTRPKDSNRNIINLAEVEAVFREFGYEVIMPDSLSLIEQVTLMNESKIVASNHGAGLTNVLFMQRGAIVFEIFSEFYFDPGPQIIALLKQMRYLYMAGQTADTSPHPQKECVYINPAQLKLALRKIEYLL